MEFTFLSLFLGCCRAKLFWVDTRDREQDIKRLTGFSSAKFGGQASPVEPSEDSGHMLGSSRLAM